MVDALIAERTVVAVIVLNTVALFMIVADHDESLGTQVWRVIDYACVVYFVVEAALKVARHGARGYWHSGWNKFDFFIVAVSLPALLSPILEVQHFSVVLVLRLGRLFRLFRLLRFIPNREHLVDGVQRALRASVGILLGLLLLNLILGIGATLLFAQFAPEHFGDPFISSYSLFKVFTVEGWHELPDLLAARANHPVWAVVARVYFVISVLVGGLLGLSLANAVFVDEMTMDNTDVLEEKVDALHAEVRELRTLLTERRGDDADG